MMKPHIVVPLFAGLLLLGAPKAEAQCGPDSALCAELNVGASFNARVQVRSQRRVVVRRAPPPPARSAQVVVVQPAQPAPPPPPPPAQPPVVVVQTMEPAPPPPQPQAQTTVVVTTEQQSQQMTTAPAQRRQPSFGVHPQASFVLGDESSMGGFRMGIRFRPGGRHFAFEFNGGFMVGNDYNGLDREEFLFGVNGYFFFNPQHRWQFYGVLGLGMAWGSASGFNRHSGDFDYMDLTHFNGEGGLGVEFRIARWFALNFDVRGVIRERINDDGRAEFTEYDDFGSPTGRETNTSGGAVANFGGVFYW